MIPVGYRRRIVLLASYTNCCYQPLGMTQETILRRYHDMRSVAPQKEVETVIAKT